MKPKPDFETPFEESLAEFEHTPLPAEWKAELIDNAISGELQAEKSKILRFPSFTKIAIGTLAACWVLIGFLHTTTATTTPKQSVAKVEKTEATTNDFPMLVQYIEARNTLASHY